MPNYYPGGGVMIGLETGTIYAELSVPESRRWEAADVQLVEEVQQQLLRRGVDQRKTRYRVIDAARTSWADGTIADLAEHGRG